MLTFSTVVIESKAEIVGVATVGSLVEWFATLALSVQLIAVEPS